VPATVEPAGLALRGKPHYHARVTCPGNILKTSFHPASSGSGGLVLFWEGSYVWITYASDGMAPDGSSQIRCGATF